MDDNIQSDTCIVNPSNNWQNIGIFSQYARKEMIKHSEQKESKKYNKSDDIIGMTRNMHSLYMLLVEYSFGYGDNSVQMGTNQMCHELQMTKPTILNIISQLFESKYVSRMEWQSYGPKQRYTYEVNLDNIKFNIHFKKNREPHEVGSKAKNKEQAEQINLVISNMDIKTTKRISDWCVHEHKKSVLSGDKRNFTAYDYFEANKVELDKLLFKSKKINPENGYEL